jgi:hypothetical protein
MQTLEKAGSAPTFDCRCNQAPEIFLNNRCIAEILICSA